MKACARGLRDKQKWERKLRRRAAALRERALGEIKAHRFDAAARTIEEVFSPCPLS